LSLGDACIGRGTCQNDWQKGEDIQRQANQDANKARQDDKHFPGPHSAANLSKGRQRGGSELLQRTRFKLIVRVLTKSYFGDWPDRRSMFVALWQMH